MTKDEILKVAAHHFAKRGYEGISLDEIAKELGITKPAIYYHFKNKADLYKAVLMERLRGLVEAIKEATNKSTEPCEKLRLYIESFGSYLQKKSCFAAILAHEFADEGIHMDKEMTQELSKTLGKLTAIINEGIEKGLFTLQNPMAVQITIVSTLIMHQTTQPLRKKVTSFIQDYEILPEPNIEDIAKILAQNILKAICKERR